MLMHHADVNRHGDDSCKLLILSVYHVHIVFTCFVSHQLSFHFLPKSSLLLFFLLVWPGWQVQSASYPSICCRKSQLYCFPVCHHCRSSGKLTIFKGVAGLIKAIHSNVRKSWTLENTTSPVTYRQIRVKRYQGFHRASRSAIHQCWGLKQGNTFLRICACVWKC